MINLWKTYFGGKSVNNPIWSVETIRLEVGDNPPQVLDRQSIPKTEASKERAQEILKQRCEDSGWTRKKGGLRAEAVRFLDENGKEMFRCTIFEFSRTGCDGDA